MAATVLLLAIGAGTAMWLWVDGLPLPDERKATAHLDVMKMAAGVAIGGGGLFTLYLAARRQHTQERELAHRERAHEHTVEDAAARRVTELYTKAADQLGSEKASVRLAGLYSLERLAQDNPEQRQTIVNLWCAYLRMPYTPPPSVTGRPKGGVARPLQRNSRRRPTGIKRPDNLGALRTETVLEQDVRASVQRILAEHLRPKRNRNGATTNPKFWPEPLDIDLTGATLIDLDLSDCVVAEIRLNEAKFVGRARFEHATLNFASFSFATFTSEARFNDTTFTRMGWFSAVTFAGNTEFSRAMFGRIGEFTHATFDQDSCFEGAKFPRDARFIRTTFNGAATFKDATFTDGSWDSSPWFTNATFAGGTSFEGASFPVLARFKGTLARMDPSQQAQNYWPLGWTCDELPETRNREGRWARMVPVPIVLENV